MKEVINSMDVFAKCRAFTTADEARAAGVDHFLSKPIFESDIADCINACLGMNPEAEKADNVDNAPQNKFGGRRILLVEDVDINREIVMALLEPVELKVDAAENGLEALRLFRENPGAYDLILMDLQMPEMDGFEATRHIRAMEREAAPESPAASKKYANGRIPIIAMTANVFREDVEKCQSAGMDDHLGKPLDIELVLEKLAKYLG